MPKNIHAFTALGGSYPEYISVNETDDPNLFTITVRSPPTVEKGAYVCGHARDKGQPGRCTAGDERCNNYCNMAPQKGPMVDHPAPCEHVREGSSAMITLTMPQIDMLAGDIMRGITGTAV